MSKEGDGGNVIRPQFGKGRATTEVSQPALGQASPSAKTSEHGDTIKVDKDFYQANGETVFDATRRVMEFDTYIRSLRGFVEKDSNVALRRQGLKGVTLEALVISIGRSGERDWVQKPAYYRALFEELSARIRAVRPVKTTEEIMAGIGDRAARHSREAKEDCLYAVAHSSDVKTALQDKSDAATNYIFDELEGFVYDRADLELRRQGLKHHRLEDLCLIMNRSTKKEWSQHPHFYGAII